ncbi:MAG: YchJ family metal-binding protein [Propionicimonas sp.]
MTSTDRSAAWPPTAEALMRSRFEAFRSGDTSWLLASWHPSTRPAALDLSHNPTWRGLQILDTVAGGPTDDTGVVEFRATFLQPRGGVDIQHERSRFIRESGRWYYLDAERGVAGGERRAGAGPGLRPAGEPPFP